MTRTPLYQTTLAPKARRGLILNAIAGALLTLLSGAQWLAAGHWLQGLILWVMLPVTALIILVFIRSRHPLEIFEDRVVLNSALRTTVPLSQIEGIGTHPKRGTPSLTYRDDAEGQSGELLIHWRFIHEPQDEVLAQVKAALHKASR